MIFKQYRYEKLAQASYLVGCSRAKEGVVVDPIADLGAESYVLDAADLGLSLVGVFETHVHADYVSGARELADMAGVPLYMHEAARGLVTYDFTPIADGHVFEIGRIRMQVIHTPGHTPESASYLVTDRARSEQPWFVLTGDALFVGDVGRPDLLVGNQALDVMDEAERARTQYESITRRLFSLPDHVEVCPAHYGGSTCGGVNMSGKVSSTIGFEKRFNLAMQQPDAEAFARFVKETAKPFPANYGRIKSCNLGLISREEIAAGARS
jgi:glyoxylase-like metal-dependent hydrolase (beta-lactamase superfamily II)